MPTLPSCDDMDDDISGVEIVSPKKCTHNVTGIGELSTSWIGQKDLCDIESSLLVEKYQSQIKTVKNELNLLAKECTNAFITAGLLQSTNPQISKAVKLCSSYYHATHQVTRRPSTISALQNLSDVAFKCPEGLKCMFLQISRELKKILKK